MPLNESSRGNPFNNRKFGIEIEVANVNQTDVARALQDAGIACAAEQYNHRTRPHWKITTDSSIRSDNGRACEIVSPILTPNRQTFEQIAQICSIIKSIGGTVNDSCGFHVHVDCRGIYDPDFWRLLLSFYSSEEDQIDSLMHPGRRGNDNSYCRSNKLRDGDEWGRLWRTDLDRENARLQTFLGAQERYRKLNFASFVRHGTVEFRQFHGTLNSEEILNWVGFCLNLVQSAFDFVSMPNAKRQLQGNVPAPTTPIVQNTLQKYFLTWFQQRQEYARTVMRRSTSAMRELQQHPIVETYDEARNLFAINHDLILIQNPDLFNIPVAVQNQIAKMTFFAIQHIALKAGMYSAEERNGRMSGYRDSSFYYSNIEERIILIKEIVAFYYNFQGTTEQKNRMVRSKLRNLGVKLNRDGYMQMVDLQEGREIAQVLQVMQQDNGRSVAWHEHANSLEGVQNRYYRLLSSRDDDGRYLPGMGNFFHNYQPNNRVDAPTTQFDNKLYGQRLNDIRSYMQNFFSNTAKLWVNSPRDLQERTRNRQTDMLSNIISLLVTVKNQTAWWINDWHNLECTVRDYLPRTPLATELYRLRLDMREESPIQRGYSEYQTTLGSSEPNIFYNLLNNVDTTVYPTLPREPYLAAAKTLRSAARVDEAWRKLVDTRKKIESGPEPIVPQTHEVRLPPAANGTRISFTMSGTQVTAPLTAASNLEWPTVDDYLRNSPRPAQREVVVPRRRTGLNAALAARRAQEEQRLRDTATQLERIFTVESARTMSVAREQPMSEDLEEISLDDY